MKTCCKCEETKPFTDFRKNNQRNDGYNSKCKVCVKIDTAKRNESRVYPPDTDTKACTKCGDVKTLGKFQKCPRHADGRLSQCKNCRNESKQKKKGTLNYPTDTDTKECLMCKETKMLKEFVRDLRNRDGKTSRCKSCHQKLSEIWRKENPEIQRACEEDWRDNNREHIREKGRLYRLMFPEKEKARWVKYASENIEKIREKSRQAYANDPDRVNRWNNKNREQRRANVKRHKEKRKATDPLYTIEIRLGNLVRLAFKKSPYTKDSRSREILGVDYDVALEHLMATGKENYGDKFTGDLKDYDIDHIYPVSLAESEEELIDLNHISNLQLLTSTHNGSKGNRLDWVIP